MFIDEAKIKVKAGDGGNGCMAFRREKFVPRGGPSGGDGGRGGDIIMESSERHNTLVHFRFNPEYTAERGRHGEGSNCTGREGEPIILKVPVGTIVYDKTIGEFPDEDSYVVADIPGLIEGAHAGTGLGMQFLRHLERTRVLAHIVDVSDASGRPDPVQDFNVIMNELASFGAGLEQKPIIV